MASDSALVFDLDGTLLHLDVPIEDVRRDIACFFAELGYRTSMRPILSSITLAAEAVADDSEGAAKLAVTARAFIDRAETEAAAKAVMSRGIASIAELVEHGKPLALVTNNSRACAEIAIARLEKRGLTFASVVTRDEVDAKPSADGLVRAWHELGQPQKLLWVGDATADMQAGVAMRARLSTLQLEVVGVLGGRNRRAELLASGADWVAGDLGEFATALRMR